MENTLQVRRVLVMLTITVCQTNYMISLRHLHGEIYFLAYHSPHDIYVADKFQKTQDSL